jgi:hypothetical protein
MDSRRPHLESGHVTCRTSQKTRPRKGYQGLVDGLVQPPHHRCRAHGTIDIQIAMHLRRSLAERVPAVTNVRVGTIDFGSRSDAHVGRVRRLA